MERIRALIDKLQQQAEQQGNIAAMMVTVQLLQAELAKASAVSYHASPSKIAVVLPGGNQFYSSQKPAAEPEAREAAEPVYPAEAGHKYSRPDVRPALSTTGLAVESGWVPDPVAELQLPVQQRKEMNEVLGAPAPSLNDRLKTERTELGTVLKETPVKDLKKAIGINDRFVFLHELFRGDEVMYERSIKTINNFQAFPEAEYWIERELKIKLGWDENKEAVKYFRQLVKRRFF